MGVWPWHYLQCGGLGGSVGDHRLVEDVDARVGFHRRWLLRISGHGGGPSPAGALSGVEEIDDTLSCGRLAAPLLGLWQGPCVVDFARVINAGEVLCVGDAQLYVDHLTTVLVSFELGYSPLLHVVGDGWVLFDV